MPRKLSTAILIRQREAKLKRLAACGPSLQGSLCRIRVTCGKPNCRCASGDKHTAYQVTRKVRGTTKSLYIPLDLLEEVQAWVAEARRLKQLLKEISDLNERLIRVHVQSHRARRKNQAGAAKSHRPSQP